MPIVQLKPTPPLNLGANPPRKVDPNEPAAKLVASRKGAEQFAKKKRVRNAAGRFIP